ncbi:MAG: hypothetical protein ACO1O3_00605 [Sphingobium sp.]
MLAEAVPRSDPALATAINAFGWHRRERDWKLSPAVAQVMQRYRDCFYLAKIAKPDSFYRNAYRRLAKPPPGHWSPAHWFGLSAIRDLLSEIRSEHPTVELYLNPDSVLWWEGRAAPMASGSRTMIAGLIAKAAAAVAGAMLWDTHRLWGALIGIWAATGCQSLIIFLVRTYANARVSALIASPDEDRRAVALDIFWLAGLPTIALLSTAIPFTLAGILLLGLMAIGLAALATIRGIVPGRANEPGGALFPFLASTWWLAAYVFIPRPLWWQGLIPVLALCWAGFFGIGRIGKYVDTMHLWHHRTAIGAHMLLAPIAAIAVQGYPALGAAAVSAWTVAHYGLSARLASWQLSLPAFYIIGFVIYQILGFTARADMPHLTMTILACLLVGTGTIRLILMWRELRLA